MRSKIWPAVVMVLVFGACSDDPALAYDEAFRSDFERACLSGVGNAGAQACACWYERISIEVPFEDLPPLDDLTATAVADDVVDPVLYEQLADCVQAFGAASTVPVTEPPPLTVPSSTTTMTIVLAE